MDHRVDWLTITECFDRHGVEYLIVGGVGAQLHGATRPTSDFDSLPKTSGENLDRLGIALRELGAYLRVEGLTDEEARALPVHLDGATLARMDISTWRTDAGDLDVLTAIPTRDGGRSRYEDLLVRASSVDFGFWMSLEGEDPEVRCAAKVTTVAVRMTTNVHPFQRWNRRTAWSPRRRRRPVCTAIA